MAKKINMYIIRHGETEFNIMGKIQGWCDSPLTENGINDAVKAGKALKGKKFDGIFSSDLMRAQKTCEIILEAAEINGDIIIDEGLREKSLGILEKKQGHFTAMEEAYEKAMAMGYHNHMDFDCLNAKYDEITEHTCETKEAFVSRLRESIAKICARDYGKEAADVLIVSHGLSIIGIIYALTGSNFVPRKIENVSITHIVYENGAFNLVKVNDRSYLKEVL